METLHRRDLLLSTAAASALLFIDNHTGVMAETGDQLVPWTDQPVPVPPPAQAVVRNLTPWENLDSWITPDDKFFGVAHYEWLALDPAKWRLDIGGHVEKPISLALDQLKARPHQSVLFTLECSGNNGLPFLTSAIGNAQWGGTPLAELLKEANVKPGALEVVFFGADKGQEVLRAGTPFETHFTGNFARSMSIEDAMKPDNLLCYEMNGAALSPDRGAPVRLIAPGWFGVANVKWLQRIEVRETRFLGRFMGRDYVTLREEQRDGETVVMETSVGRGLLKSAPARVVRNGNRHSILGMAWGPTPISAVEVKIDGGPWTKAVLAEADPKSPFAWRFWRLDWSASPGDHTITSRATDTAGRVQPAMDDPLIANKKTYWESNGQLQRKVHVS